MGYGVQNEAQTVARPSLTTDTGRLVDRLEGIKERLRSLSDVIHGPAPREANMKGDKPPSAISLRRHNDAAYNEVCLIEDELTRIENAL